MMVFGWDLVTVVVVLVPFSAFHIDGQVGCLVDEVGPSSKPQRRVGFADLQQIFCSRGVDAITARM